MFTHLKREYSIYKTLTCISKQRVVLLLQPGNAWVIEKAFPDTDQNQANIRTCIIRGWVDLLHESIPSTNLDDNYDLSKELESNNNKKDIYKLTDSGWNAIHRTHVITLLSIIIALLGVFITLPIG